MKTTMIAAFALMMGGIGVGYAADEPYKVILNLDLCKDSVSHPFCYLEFWREVRSELGQEQKKSFTCSEAISSPINPLCTLDSTSMLTQEFIDSGKKTTLVLRSDGDKKILTIETDDLADSDTVNKPYKVKYNFDICSTSNDYKVTLCNHPDLWKNVRSEITAGQDSFTCDGPSQGITGVIFDLCSMELISDDMKFTQILNSQKTTVHFYSDSGNRKINLSVEDESWKTRIYKKWQKIWGD